MAHHTDIERNIEIVKLRTTGLSFQKIGDQFGIGASAAQRAYRKALSLVPAEAVNELRETEKARLERVLTELWAIVEAKHPYVSQGRVFHDLEDAGPKLSALAGIVKTSEAMRKLYGLDAPNRVAVSVVTADAVDAEIERLSQQIAGQIAPADAGDA